MRLVDKDFSDLEEKVSKIVEIGEDTSNNGNDYVYIEDMSGQKFYVWSDGWQEYLIEEKDRFLDSTVRINYEAVDPPYYCVFRYLTPLSWDDVDPAEKDFDERCLPMTNEDNETLKTSDVSREERIVNQASMKFAAKILDHRLEDRESYSDEEISEELNKWMSKFKRAAITGEV